MKLKNLPTPVKVLLIFGALYLFLVGIGAMGASFKLMGKEYTKELLGSAANPLVSLFIGILATTLVQSSSTTTSIVVGMVAAGAIELHSAVFMVMGANVGTTVTNTIVSLGHITRSAEYKRAFAAATVHDFFNMLVLLVLFPIEVYTGVLDHMADGATELFEGAGGTKLANPIKMATKPLINVMKDGVSGVEWIPPGTLLLILAIILTFGMLIFMVKILRSIMVTRLENLFDRLLFKTPYRALGLGILMTVLVQSSSITTSVAVPLVGAGLLTIQQVFPFTMGANIGTTVTAVIASLGALAAAGPENHDRAILGVTLAFHHVMFNVVGVALLWPLRSIPIAIANAFANLTMWNRVIPLVYILVTFYALPFAVILLGR